MRRRRRQRIGGTVGIALSVFTLFAGFLGDAYAIAREIGDKIECHAFQLIAKEILARGGPGATTIQDIGEQDLCGQPYSMAQAICQDLLESDVCSLKQLVAEKICPAVDQCQAVVDWFTNTKVAAKTWLVTRLKGAATWLMDHATLAWGSVSSAVSGIQAALRGDGSPGASPAQESEAGAELDDQIVGAEGGGSPATLPADSEIPGIEAAAETIDDLRAGGNDCGGCSGDTGDAADDTARTTAVDDAVEAAATESGLKTALRVASSVARVGLRVAGWVGMGLMAYQLVSEILQGYQISDQTLAGGLGAYSPGDLWFPTTSCTARYALWATALSDPASEANFDFQMAMAGVSNDQSKPLWQGVYADADATDYIFKAILDATTGGLGEPSGGVPFPFVPTPTVSLWTIYQAALHGGTQGESCTGPAPAATPAEQSAITAAYATDLDLTGFDGAAILSDPSTAPPQCTGTTSQQSWFNHWETVSDLIDELSAGGPEALGIQDQGWWDILSELAPPTTSLPDGLQHDGCAGVPVVRQQLLRDLGAGDDGPYWQLLDLVEQEAGSTSSSPLAADAIAVVKDLPSECGCTGAPQAPTHQAGPASTMSETDADSLLLALSDVLGAGDPTQVAAAYVTIDPTGTSCLPGQGAEGGNPCVFGGVGGNVGSTALLPSQMATGFAQASPGGTLDPASAQDQYLATAAVVANDLTLGGGDLNQAYATYVSQNHLPPYGGSWSGGYSTDPAQAPSGINQGQELNVGNWGLEAGAYQKTSPAVPTAYLLTTAAADWEGWLDADDLGNQPVQPPADLLLGQPMPPSDLLGIFEDAAQTYDTSLPLLLAIAAQESGFTEQCEAVGAPTGQEGSDIGVMGMAPGVFSSTKAPPGLEMGATAADASGTPLSLDGRTWKRSETLPGNDPGGACPRLGEEAGMLDPTAEIDVAAFLLHQDGATPDASSDQLRTAAASFYDDGVTTVESTGLTYAQPWVQSVVLVRLPAYTTWLSGGAPATGSAGCSGGIGTICPEPETPVFPWVPPRGYPDGFPAGQCTYWAAYNSWAVSTYGIGGDANGTGADSWIASAESRMPPGSVLLAGQPDAVPAVGDIVVYQRGFSYNVSLGHVAVVVAVDPDPGAPQGISGYWVSEMNFIGLGKVDERHIAWPDPAVAALIPGMPPGVGG